MDRTPAGNRHRHPAGDYAIAISSVEGLVLAAQCLSLRRRGRAVPSAGEARRSPVGIDRFSAPLEKRYSESEARRLLEQAGLHDVRTQPMFGWLVDGVR
jgi:hypothetical protein